MKWPATLLAVLVVLVFPAFARARVVPAPAAPPAAAPTPAALPSRIEEEAADSPRASMRRFLDLSAHAQWREASTYLDVPRAQEKRGPELASRLHEVLERKLVIHPELLSPQSSGAPDASGGILVLGEIDGGGRPQPITIERRPALAPGEHGVWVFGRGTVDAIDRLYDALETDWASEHLPAPFLARGPKGLYVWQWLGIPVLALGSAAAGLLLTWLLGLLVRVVVDPCSRTARFLPRLRQPVRLAWATVAFWLASPLLVLPLRASEFVDRLLGALGYLALFWAAILVLMAAGDEATEGPWVDGRPTARTLTVVGVRLGKAVVVAIGLMLALSRLGYSPTSIVAGLGLGGIVVALAAQKTVENFIGSIAILVDQPFHIGDRIRVGDFVRPEKIEGVVESIGLRTTRLRTTDRTVIVIPNGKLADSRIESLSEREVARLTTHVRLSRAPSASQLRVLRASLKRAVRKHPLIRASDVTVELGEIGESSFDLHVTAFVETIELDEFDRVRGEVLLACIETVDRSGFELALPTHSVIATGPQPAPRH
ncbi:Potassium efflux system KefA protein / Small-conductance mechanosensitive channel [Labilithrix luteola]|uniref:Potassium efflux system KefA protein / Small-conductance mechanosensitive channel n=1 Tax=Labilithrix luteola TaxID=1391654 RepID=A0A0K1Q718_9BACT|nr:mechanosensitive ion channel family protein [Labilithrix luteola]AKV01514.1 Potassium efflux system KefA protein / Small-conductance mechanosensitive channel [Labilithrix luteola]